MKTMSQATLTFFIVCFILLTNSLFQKFVNFKISSQSSQPVIAFVDFDGRNRTTVMPENLTKKQAAILEKAYLIAEKDGHKNPEILQGILLQESHAGNLKSYKVAGQELGLKTNLRYYGIFQMKLAAARDVLLAYPNLKSEFKIQTNTDEEIIANLIMNDTFAIAAASKYLIILQKRYRIKNENSVIAAYNQGPIGYRKIADTSQFGYVTGVRRLIEKHKVSNI